MITAEEITVWTSGRRVSGNPHEKVPAISTDTRTLQPGEFFLALSGARFDGHDFLKEAAGKGAGGVITKGGRPLPAAIRNSDLVVIEVEDTLTALGDLARAYRKRHSVRCVAITGSVGKTSTKNLLVSVLRGKNSVCGTDGNKNNQIGVPLTLLRLNSDHRFLVTELGTDQPGEIARLTRIVAPEIGVITAIEPCHLKGMGSLCGVAVEKAQLFAGLPSDGVALLRSGVPFAREVTRVTTAPVLTFGLNESSDYRAEEVRLDEEGRPTFRIVEGAVRLAVRLNLIGRHQVINATAAYAAARNLGIDPEEIARGLSECCPEWGRLETRATAHGAFLLEDVYNASPASYRAALEVMTARSAERRYVVAGDMLDLGDHAEDAHRELGRAFGAAGLDGLYVLGDWQKVVVEAARENGLQPQRIRWGMNHEEIVQDLERTLHRGDVVLVKGSRDMKMEKISRALAPAT